MKELRLTNTKKVALVDSDDFEKININNWYLLKGKATFYAFRDGVYLHRLIMGFPDKPIHHINGNGLDNRKANLKILAQSTHRTTSKGRGKSSKYKGICKRGDKWVVSIGTRESQKHLGYYNSEIEAAKVYDFHAKKLYGEFAYLNFPDQT